MNAIGAASSRLDPGDDVRPMDTNDVAKGITNPGELGAAAGHLADMDLAGLGPPTALRCAARPEGPGAGLAAPSAQVPDDCAGRRWHRRAACLEGVVPFPASAAAWCRWRRSSCASPRSFERQHLQAVWASSSASCTPAAMAWKARIGSRKRGMVPACRRGTARARRGRAGRARTRPRRASSCRGRRAGGPGRSSSARRPGRGGVVRRRPARPDVRPRVRSSAGRMRPTTASRLRRASRRAGARRSRTPRAPTRRRPGSSSGRSPSGRRVRGQATGRAAPCRELRCSRPLRCGPAPPPVPACCRSVRKLCALLAAATATSFCHWSLNSGSDSDSPSSPAEIVAVNHQVRAPLGVATNGLLALPFSPAVIHVPRSALWTSVRR